MLDVVATDEHELSSPIHACRINHSQSGLASAGGAVAQALASKPAHEPQGQRQQPENHYEREQYFERVSLAEQGVEHHSSPAPSVEGIRLDRSSRERQGIAADLNTTKINQHIRSVLLLYTRSIADVNSRIQWCRSYFASRLRIISHYRQENCRKAPPSIMVSMAALAPTQRLRHSV
jgi:hypothetical protein